MKRALIALFILYASAGICGALHAQDAESSAPSETADSVEQKPAANEAVKKSPSPEKSAVKSVSAGNVAPQNASVAGSDSLSLMEMNEGTFRSARIPGMTFEKKGVIEAGKNDMVRDTGGKDQRQQKSKFKRLLPMFTVAGIVLFIVLVYRIGRRKRKGNVFRRFP